MAELSTLENYLRIMYRVEFSKNVQRKLKKLSKLQIKNVVSVVDKLEQDPFQRSLKTHKLSGKSSGIYSCSMNYSDRVLFVIIIKDVVTIIDIGSHDDVY